MTDTQIAAAFFLEIAVILAACRLVGWLGQRFGQPQVVGEMVAGFLLGPSLFGAVVPAIQQRIFPPETVRILFVVSQLGLVLYMFCVGLEFRTDVMLKHARRAAAVSLAGIVVPFALGGALGLVMLESGGFFTDDVRPFHAAVFLGAAMAITAFPVLARIIYERGIVGTGLGTLTLAAGAMNDAAAWIILAIVLGSFNGSGALALIAAGGAVVYLTVTVAARLLFARLDEAATRQGVVTPWMLTLALCALASGAWFTEVVGLHSVFGAFILGAAIPRGLLSRELQRLVEPVTTALLVPLFFVYSGLHSELGLLSSAWLWTVAGAVLVTAIIGKGGACWAAARATGASPRDALAVGTLMNARGMMELILVSIGLQRGLITPTLFTILVIMAIATTLMTGPLFGFIYRREFGEPAADRIAVGDTP